MADGAPKNPNAPTVETVRKVTHWSDRLFSFRISRPASFRFRSGEFVMIGLQVDGKPLLRAYSMASPSWDEELEFYSIKVPDGPLTSRLQNIKEGDEVILGRKPTGTLVLDALTPAKRLFLISTGTGVAPFASVTRDPETYEQFEQVILTQTTWTPDGLKYAHNLVDNMGDDPLVGDVAPGKLTFWGSCTRDESEKYQGRITDMIKSGKFYEDLGIGALNPETDRIMICGSMAMLKDVSALAEAHGFKEGSNAAPAEFVVERAFVG